jgi:hypothetical protein
MAGGVTGMSRNGPGATLARNPASPPPKGRGPQDKAQARPRTRGGTPGGAPKGRNPEGEAEPSPAQGLKIH